MTVFQPKQVAKNVRYPEYLEAKAKAEGLQLITIETPGLTIQKAVPAKVARQLRAAALELVLSLHLESIGAKRPAETATEAIRLIEAAIDKQQAETSRQCEYSRSTS